VNQERKISVLRQLLERVQRRAAALPVSVSALSVQSSKPQARPGSATLPADFGSGGESVHPPDAVAEPPFLVSAQAPEGSTSDRAGASQPESESEQGPPSAPRLREVPEEDAAPDEGDIDDEEAQIKTPPPESGRQHVTPSPSVTVTEPDEDISITVTMEESEAPPPISPSPPEVSPIPLINRPRVDMPDVTGPQPRLALVSEPEIELHGMTPLSAMAETLAPSSLLKAPPVAEPPAVAAPPLRPQDIELAVAVPPPAAPSLPAAAPSGIRPVPPTPAAPFASPPAPAPPPPTPAPPATASPVARTAASMPDTKPPVSAPAPSAAPPIRLMAEPLADAPHEPSAPVEVWASTFAPAALRAQVASFVGQNANFEAKTFGELVRASLELGEDEP
jgi:hypothetical protein